MNTNILFLLLCDCQISFHITLSIFLQISVLQSCKTLNCNLHSPGVPQRQREVDKARTPNIFFFGKETNLEPAKFLSCLEFEPEKTHRCYHAANFGHGFIWSVCEGENKQPASPNMSHVQLLEMQSTFVRKSFTPNSLEMKCCNKE